LRNKWLAVGLLGLFFLACEVFELRDRPLVTAWILVGYFATAFAVDTLFRGASFCKYICPIGQFNFIGSLVSPLEVRVRRPKVCSNCATHDCLRGNEHHRGCELGLFLPRKAGSIDCTFCLDCVKACPHDNVGIVPVNIVHNLVNDPIRSALGRLSQRADIAALALVLVFASFVNAAAMVAPVSAWRDVWIGRLSLTSAAPVTALLFLIVLLRRRHSSALQYWQGHTWVTSRAQLGRSSAVSRWRSYRQVLRCGERICSFICRLHGAPRGLFCRGLRGIWGSRGSASRVGRLRRRC